MANVETSATDSFTPWSMLPQLIRPFVVPSKVIFRPLEAPADRSDEFFFDHVIDTLSDDSDDDSEVIMAMALLLLNYKENQRQRYKGLVLGHITALDRNQEPGHEQLYLDYFHRTKPLFKEPLFR
jgi:hypothetical protein